MYSEQGVSCVVSKTPHDVSRTVRKTNDVPEVQNLSNTTIKCQKGGEGVAIPNSEMLRGVLISKLDEGGVVGQSQRKNENILVSVDQPQNWYQKLQVFRAEKSEHTPEYIMNEGPN